MSSLQLLSQLFNSKDLPSTCEPSNTSDITATLSKNDGDVSGNRVDNVAENIQTINDNITNLSNGISTNISNIKDDYLGYKIYQTNGITKWPIVNDNLSEGTNGKITPCLGCAPTLPDNDNIFCMPSVLTPNYKDASSNCWKITDISGHAVWGSSGDYIEDINRLTKNFNCIDNYINQLQTRNSRYINQHQDIFSENHIINDTSGGAQINTSIRNYEELKSLNLAAEGQIEFSVFYYRRTIAKIITLAILMIYWIVILNIKKKK